MNYTKVEILGSIEQTMRTLKLGGLAKEWRNVTYRDNEQYMRDLPDVEVREREANRMARMVKRSKEFIVTSNVEFSGWNTVFGNDKLTAAMIENDFDCYVAVSI